MDDTAPGGADDPVALARALRAEADPVDQRRLLVLTGDRDPAYDAVRRVVAGLDAADETTLVGESGSLPVETIAREHTDRLLGRTREVVIYDAIPACRPTDLGRVTGAVDGGGLLVILTPPLDEWPDGRDGFDEGLAVPPFEVDDVTGHFRRRLVGTLRTHEGVAIHDVDAGRTIRDGLTDPPPVRPSPPPSPPEDRVFPVAAYDATLTAGQTAAVASLERLREGVVAVVSADRGRGKSSACGIAAGALAAAGRDVLVTAPGYRNAREVLVRAAALLGRLGERADGDGGDGGTPPRTVETAAGGRVAFRDPEAAAAVAGDVDCAIVDEAASFPVDRLAAYLDADAVAYATTVRGYEGAGRGFDVRFRDRLAETGRDVVDIGLTTPIRYAPGDPVETWAFRALALDAGPPVAPLIEDATPATVTYRRFDPAALADDEATLAGVFGLLVLAHYRTEPDDLARLLDAPNLSVRALTHDGHVVSVALLAREGGLDEATRRRTHDGRRIRGTMIPDVLTSQLRDERAGEPVGWRIVRIATHHAVRSRGLGSALLDRIEAELDGDWLGSGFGVTPRLLRFWRANGYRPVHLSTTRNDRSGEHSAIVLRPTSPAGERLTARTERRFYRRLPGVLSDPLSTLSPDVVRATIGPDAALPPLDLADWEWRVVADAAYGPGQFDVAPRAFRPVVVYALALDPDESPLSAREERLLVRTVLQAADREEVAADLGYHSRGECMRALGDALAAVLPALADADPVTRSRERYGGDRSDRPN